MRVFRLMIWVMLAALSGAPQALAAGDKGTRIAAVVGKDVVSTYDIDNRVKFILATTHMSDTPEVQERIRPQVLRSLIDEKLQLQEAEKNNIAITDKDINQAIASIENERGMPGGAIFTMLEQSHVPKETFTGQIRAQLAWSRILARTVRSRVKVSDEEIELARKKILTPTAAQELQIAVISLPIDKIAAEEEVHRLAQKLVNEIKTGASFEEVSRQFGSSAAKGKVATFWVRPEQLDPAIAKALLTAKTGMVTDPVRTEIGYSIVKVYDAHVVSEDPTKDEEVNIKEILLRLKPDAGDKEANALLQIGEEVARHPGSCEEKGLASVDNLEDFDIEVNFVGARMQELPAGLRTIAGNLKKGEISTPFASSEGIKLYMLCDRKEAAPIEVDRDRVANMVFQQKMELEAQKYIRNLRRNAFIEVR